MRDLEDRVFLRKAVWKYEFAFLPHRCRISKKIIWLKKAYKGTATYPKVGYPTFGLPITETHWHSTGEHIKWLLTKENSDYTNTIIPLVRKIVPSLIAQEIIGVQPMGVQPPTNHTFTFKK